MFESVKSYFLATEGVVGEANQFRELERVNVSWNVSRDL
jgi:hypothetical protein